MKKVFGITIGGILNKILFLVLADLLMLLFVFVGVSFYQKMTLAETVGTAQEEQQATISGISESTMHQVLESSMLKTNAMQAYMADQMFGSVKKEVITLQSLAQSMFINKDIIVPGEVYPPDPANDGKTTAQVLCAEGVDYTKSEFLPTAARMTDMMTAMYDSSEYSTNVFIGFEDGTHISVDKISSNKFDENGKLIAFPVCERPWYKGAKETGSIFFTGVTKDTYTDKTCITCSAPVYLDGRIIGVVGIDIFLDTMEAYVAQSGTGDGGSFICILNGSGQTVFAPDNNDIFKANVSGVPEDLRKSENKELAAFVSDATGNSTGLRTVKVSGKDYYMTATPLGTIGWTVVTVVDKELTERPTKLMLDEYEKINNNAQDKFTRDSSRANTMVLIVLAVVMIISILGVIFFARRIVRPIESMTAEIIEGGRTGKMFEMKDIYKTKDEIQVLAESFDDLSKKTKQYIIDITNITKEKERIGTELELARKIQADMLPNIYPAFPDRPELDIYATMTPAKEVGGDFYDFFLIDDDHLGMVMADVSGKGVPAALFMMMSKILLSNYAMQGGSPAKVLEQTNAAICKKNEEEMFVTVWFGVLEISTGKITAANAGHEYPIIRKANGDYELLKDKHGFVIGGMDGMKFKEYEIMLEKGGELFLYTDGVPEATNADGVLFGTDRLLAALNANRDCGPRQLLPKIKEAVDGFVGEADQFDDLTMLAVKLV